MNSINSDLKKGFSVLMVLVCLFAFSITAFAENPISLQSQTYIEETFEDGSYFVITITEHDMVNTRSTITKSAQKTGKHMDKNGNVLWTITVKGSFTYNGSTSKCTNSSVSVKSYVSNWTVSGAKAWKSGSTAYASAQGKMKNVLGQTTRTVNKQVSLTCSPSGKLS